jgi:hypothetical protein
MTIGHQLRLEIFDRLPEQVGTVRTWKHKSPPRINDKREVIEPYMFHIAVENSKHNGYYSEKLLDSFVAKALPVYWGCPNLQEHFNSDGYLTFNDYSDLECVLSQLTPEFYKARSEAIEDNFQRALRVVHQWDLIELEITKAINRKHAEGDQRVPTHNEPQAPQIGSRPLRRLYHDRGIRTSGT